MEQVKSPQSGPVEESLSQILAEARTAAEAGQIERAISLLDEQVIENVDKVIDADPSRTDLMFLMANTFHAARELDKAEGYYRRILDHEPNPLAYINLGHICHFSGRLSEAIRYRREALELCPDEASLYHDLGCSLIFVGRKEEGIEMLRKAVRLAPDDPDIHSTLLFRLHHMPQLDPPTLYREHKKWADVHAPMSLAAKSHANIPDPERRLRVGYMSPDFRTHPVAYNFEAFLSGRDRDAVEAYGYGNVACPDAMTDKLASLFDHYRNIRGMDDRAVADMIERDRIDILVPIGGHVPDNRLLVTAYKPAPIVVDYGGINTSGMEQIDYRLTDCILDRPETQEFYVEELVYLPGGLICYSPPNFAPPVGPLPALAGGHVTFGVFNNGSKINHRMMSLWAQILKANDNSRLLLKSRAGDDQAVRDSYYDQFEKLGIPAERVDICGQRPSVEYFELFNRIDIALDTYPYNGCMTTLEGLWMGVPAISLVGENYVSRWGLSMLTRIGLESLVASTDEEYIAKASSLAQDLEALVEMRFSMRRRMSASTLCNARAFAQSVEGAFREMWRKWCRNRGVEIPQQACRSGSGRTQAESSDGLRFTTGKDGKPRINLSAADMPQFLVDVNAAVEAGQIDQAAKLLNDRNIDTIKRMVESNTCKTDVLFMLALMYFCVKDFHNSEIWFKEVLKRRPHALVYHELGRICMFTGRMSEAMHYREKAMQADPENAGICGGYATDLIRMGKKQEGVELLKRAVELAPADPLMHSQLLWNLSFLPEVNPQMLLDEHKRWAQIHAPVSLARTSRGNTPDPERRIKVGYISPDFRKHSVAYNFEAFLDGSDRQAVESYGYGNIGLPDEVTERLKGKFDHYRHIRGLSDETVADMIAGDAIDILVEIGGHTVDNRLGVLAYKPAPIQVDYGGISSMGMPQIDYRLTDSVLDSEQTQKFYAEESVYLPGGQICYKPPEFAPPVGPLPAAQNGYVTFASFNNSCKINDQIVALWAEILRATENSRLLMKFRGGYDQNMKDLYCSRFEQLGIDRDRVGTCGWKSSAEHLKLYGHVDIALDTYPYTGTMTSLEAMWMGVPVISLYGDSDSYFLSRVGLSILGRIGLEFFACPTPAEYVKKAAALSQNLEALAKIRASMRLRMANSTLCDAKAYAASVEAAYRKMWRKWCEDRD